MLVVVVLPIVMAVAVVTPRLRVPALATSRLGAFSAVPAIIVPVTLALPVSGVPGVEPWSDTPFPVQPVYPSVWVVLTTLATYRQSPALPSAAGSTVV